MTSYNRKIYWVDRVEFSKCPLDSFQMNDNESSTFLNYYEQKYKLKISNGHQPMLVHISEKKNETA